MRKIPISIVVTHTPQDRKRRKFLSDMEEDLGGVWKIRETVLSYKVLTDPLMEENQRNRCNRICAERGWRLPYHPDATHVLQLQDDLKVAKGFFRALEQIIEAVPNDIVSLMTLKSYQIGAYERGEYWVNGNGGLTGQAIIIPVGKILPMWDWIDEWLPDVKYYDMPISTWAMVHGEKIWITCPSIVEHLGASHSLIGHSNNRHVAGLFLPDVTHIDFRKMPEKIFNTGTMNHAAHYRSLLEQRREALRVAGVS